MPKPPAMTQRGLKNPASRWLDDKMAAFGNGKLVPPARVLTEGLSERVEGRLQERITERILREARIEEKVASALQDIDLPMPEDLCAFVQAALTDQPAASWRVALDRVADQLLAAQGCEGASPERAS
jgi:hypothetical protein